MGEEERRLARGFAINRFRGDVSLLMDGVRLLENKTGKKCLGVFPFLHDVEIDAEDSVSLEEMGAPAEGARIAIVAFPRMSNFTDFRLLGSAKWVTAPVGGEFDCVILPGSKNTAGDLAWMRARGLEEWVRARHAAGSRIVGVCGGYQMLGERIEDPQGVESGDGVVAGLGLLPVRTVLRAEKTTRVVEGETARGTRFSAYEIHMGETERPAGAEPFAFVDGEKEGIRVGDVMGTYLHGAFENEAVVEELLGLRVAAAPERQAAYDRLADWFEENADLAAFEELYL
jgi:adenosylcobyric acid synthase